MNVNKNNEKMEFKNYTECFICDGTGYTDSVGPSCFKVASECCGGCYDRNPCGYCYNGEIHPINEEMEDNIMVLNAYNKMLPNLLKTHSQFLADVNSYHEDAFNEMAVLLDSDSLNTQLHELQIQINRVEKHKERLQHLIMDEIENTWL